MGRSVGFPRLVWGDIREARPGLQPRSSGREAIALAHIARSDRKAHHHLHNQTSPHATQALTPSPQRFRAITPE